MIRKVQIVAAAATILLTTGMLCAQTLTTAAIGHAELQQMIRNAHAAQQYEALASYYRGRQRSFEQQAQSEKLEWERRSQNVTGPAAKNPRPADSSRNRYEYFAYEAQQMNQQATYYESLSSGSKQ
ncbi:MAG TPA: hypothetical protein VGF96_07815 [Terracidiphilus sp.]|jgi:hypothetical protein